MREVSIGTYVNNNNHKLKLFRRTGTPLKFSAFRLRFFFLENDFEVLRRGFGRRRGGTGSDG